MVSPEVLRRYPFFTGLTMDQIVILAKASQELSLETDQYFFKEGDELDNFYLVLEGQAGIIVKLPKKDVVFTTLGSGDVFGWSALVPPKTATSGAKALTNCRVIAFDGQEIWNNLEADPQFGFIMMQRIAQVIRTRLEYLRIETLAFFS
jgi:CRP/FNR family transcriptional regulator, cyclic AMP receptor protein